MAYWEDFTALRGLFNENRQQCLVPDGDILIERFSFVSENHDLLPGRAEYRCTDHYRLFSEKVREAAPRSLMERMLHLEDARVRENISFTYPVFSLPEGETDRIIVLFHGLNERNWEKYLPWAQRLVRATGKAVVLFPTAFHMNRAPLEWRDPRLMRSVSEHRGRLFPSLSCSTFANAAISTRLQALPQRFFWSGVQTYRDFLQLLRLIRKGRHARISKHATVDLFGYSIGAFLAELLLMIEPSEEVSCSRLFIFCGGPTFDRMSPVSRYILDSEAVISLYAFFIQNLEEELKRNDRLAHFLGSDHPEGYFFRSMLDYHAMREVREARLRQVGKRIQAVALAGDTVIRPEEVVNTLKGFGRDVPVEVAVEDFPYPYSHENPFPPISVLSGQVDRCFDRLFDRAAGFLR